MLKNILELIKSYANIAGYSDSYTDQIIVLVITVSLSVILLYKLANRIALWRNQRLLNRDLAPYYTAKDVYRATRYYIPTNFQNVAPSEDEEPSSKYIASAKNELIPLFLRKVFNRKKYDYNKYFLILADSGMGKTTFMINLYLAYKNQIKWLFSLPSYHIKLLPLGDPHALEMAEKLPDKENTILLLDAFDEDIKATSDYQARMQEILKATTLFRAIVITCRTQFFPSRKEEPYETGYFSYGESGEYKFQKLYLSVFDDKDVKKYLRKRFYIYSFRKRCRAGEIVKKSPNLVVRPMLLSHIEDLVHSNREYEFSHQIYEVLIERWIDREASKPGIRTSYGSKENYERLLYQFSQELAVNLYENRKQRGGYYTTKEDNFGENVGIKITDISSEDLRLSESDRRSKSLLNRNSEGKYKFSHKSIMEYFLAKKMMDHPDFLKNFEFDGMDAAKNFYNELLVVKLRNLNGQYTTFSNSKLKNIGLLQLNELSEPMWLVIKDAGNMNPLAVSRLDKLKIMQIYDRERYCPLYASRLIYRIFVIPAIVKGYEKLRHLLEISKQLNLLEKEKVINPLESLEVRMIMTSRQEQLELLLRTLLEPTELSQGLAIWIKSKLPEWIELQGVKELPMLVEPPEIRVLRVMLDRIKFDDWEEWVDEQMAKEMYSTGKQQSVKIFYENPLLQTWLDQEGPRELKDLRDFEGLPELEELLEAEGWGELIKLGKYQEREAAEILQALKEERKLRKLQSLSGVHKFQYHLDQVGLLESYNIEAVEVLMKKLKQIYQTDEIDTFLSQMGELKVLLPNCAMMY